MASEMRLVWQRPPTSLIGDFKSWANRTMDKVYAIAQEIAKEWENFAKTNAPWQDRTGEARARLSALAVRTGSVISIILAHGVFYGFYLETMQGGRFAIVGPTVTIFANQAMQRLDMVGVK